MTAALFTISRGDASRAIRTRRLWRGQYFFPQDEVGNVPGACCAVGAIMREAGYEGESNADAMAAVAANPVLRELSRAFETCNDMASRKDVAQAYVAAHWPEVLSFAVAP